MRNLPTYDQFINESVKKFKAIWQNDYDINNDNTILINANLSQDVINNVAKGGDAAAKIKKDMIKILKKYPGGIDNLSAFTANHINYLHTEFEVLKRDFLGSEFKNVKFRKWWRLGGQEKYQYTISAGTIYTAVSPNNKLLIWADLHHVDPINDTHLPTCIVIKQN